MIAVTGRGLAIAGRLDATDIDLKAGELTCLIGPNGSGKTSLLHALAGIGRPAGEVRIGGRDPAELGPAERPRTIGFLPASREIKWPLKAIDVIRLGGGDPEAPVAALDIGHLAHRRIDRLSTGERSRVLIARALAPRPSLLLLDEPAANLDPLWQLRLMEHLRAVARRGESALLVAMHDLDLARRYADRLIVMEKGRIVADGGPEDLFAGSVIPAVFGIERSAEGWRPVA